MYQLMVPLAKTISAHGEDVEVRGSNSTVKHKAMALDAAIKHIQQTVGKKDPPDVIKARLLEAANPSLSVFNSVVTISNDGKNNNRKMICLPLDAASRLDKLYAINADKVLLRYLDPLENVGPATIRLDPLNSRLDEGIDDVVGKWYPSPENTIQANKLVSVLNSVVKMAIPGAKTSVRLFGSRVYGLCCNHSDLDVVIMVYKKKGDYVPIDSKLFARVARALGSVDGFQRIIKIQHARVPIIKFTYRSRGGLMFEGDISFNSRLSISKTALIQQYISLDPRVRSVLQVLKIWAAKRNIGNPNSLNSFGILMMGIAFLISCRVIPPLQLLSTVDIDDTAWRNLEVILNSPEAISRMYYEQNEQSEYPDEDVYPEYLDEREYENSQSAEGTRQPNNIYCLQTGKELPNDLLDGIRAYFAKSASPNKWKSTNTSSAAELLYEFFYFFGNKFDPTIHAVSPRLGSVTVPRTSLPNLNNSDCMTYLQKPNTWDGKLRLLAIEDPLEPWVNCGRNAPSAWVEGFFWEMRRAAYVLLPKSANDKPSGQVHRPNPKSVSKGEKSSEKTSRPVEYKEVVSA
ncbi:hypothetical protein GGI07_000380 [Coemansia sp. Benny D115]|nr:hypothetical protein GGI07_000380 [Coemansia sp. Benny D115]